jgi:Putative  PD-(D/E)XK family member, (DUF4420)
MSNRRTDSLSLLRSFFELDNDDLSSGAIRGRSVSGPYMVGVDRDGYANFLVRVESGPAQAPILTTNLEAAFGIQCDVSIDDLIERMNLVRVKCRDTDPRTVSHFYAICESLINILGDSPTAFEVQDAISRLASLFMSLNSTPRATVSGLIGELVLILALEDSAAAVLSWRMRDFDRVDFVFDRARVEVKSTTSSVRRHILSHAQANSPGLLPTLFASVFVEFLDHGVSVADLVDMIAERMKTPAQIFKLRETVGETMGSDVLTLGERYLDLDLSLGSLQLFAASDIPAIRGELPSGVSAVQFESDFSAAAPIEKSWAASLGLRY